MSTNLQVVKGAIDTYLSKTSFLPGIEVLLVIYVDEVMGFKKATEELEQIVEDSEGAITQQEIEELLNEQKQEVLEKLKDPSNGIRKQFEAKVNELRAMLAELSQLVSEMAKQLAQSISAAFMPTMVSPGIPNPAYTALRIILDILAIKRAVDTILRIVSSVLGRLSDLGLENTDIAERVTSLVQPILSLKDELDSRQRDAESELQNNEVRSKYKVVNPLTGKEIDYATIEGKAREWEISEWPLTKKAKKKVKRKINKAEDDDNSTDDEWGKIILDYNEFLFTLTTISGSGNSSAGGSDDPGGGRRGGL